MKDQEIQKFWRDKEKELGSTLLKASYARYVDGYPSVSESADGLLYIMKNGVYFETFPKDHWLDKVFRRKEDPSRIFICLKKECIADVSCFPGQKNKFSIPFGKRLASLFGLLPRMLLVEYREGERTGVVRFACAETPLSLCSAYYHAGGE